MARTPINPHITANQGGYSRDRSISAYQRMQSRSAMCVDDYLLARDVLARNGVPILRTNAANDDDIDAKLDPIEYVDSAHTQATEAERDIPGAALKTRLHIGNELGSTNPARLDAWMQKAIDRATFHKRKVVACNWSVFNPDPGIIDALPKTRAALLNNGGEMGFHEGTLITPKGVVIRTLQDALKHGAIGGYRPYMQKYGLRVRITEFAASFSPHDGWSTWMSEGEFAQLCDDAARLVYAPDGVEVHVFTLFKWDKGRGFEYIDAPTLQDKFARTNAAYEVKEQPVTQQPIPAPTEGGVLSALTTIPGVYINVRPQPGSATDSGDLLKGDVVKVYPPVNGWVYAEPVNPVARPEGRQPATKGWVSLQNGAVVFEKVPDPTPAPEKYLTFREADIEAAKTALRNALALLEKGAPSTDGDGFR